MSGRDRISELPECLLTQILSYLPTKQSVQTSVLSKRWENLYLSVPGLDLDCSSIPYDADQVLLRFIDKLLEFSPESFLFKVKFKCRETVIDGFIDRIGTMIDRGTQHLDIESSICFIDVFRERMIGNYYLEEDHIHYSPFDFMPFNLFTSKTLVYLKLSSSGIGYPGLVFMPCLKFMHLEEVIWDTHLDTLISGCPVLEELTLLRDPRDKYKALLVRTQSLKRFRVLPLRNGYVRCRSRVKCTLKIDAPGLEHMSLGDDQIYSIVVKNLTSLCMVELDIKFRVLFITGNESKRSEISDFLNGISSVRHMIISAKTVQALDRYSQVGMIPNFNNLSRLQAVFHSKLLQFLPAFLECCPNLKHLVLKVFHSEEMGEGLELTDVPRCVSLTLECVEIQEKLEKEEGKMKLASYFLENSPVLKKLILSPTAYKPRDVVESEIYNKIGGATSSQQSSRWLDEGNVKKPGYTVTAGHKNYDLMLNLQLWIRYSVGKHVSVLREGIVVINSRCFWYLDQFGMSSMHNTKVYCRQALVGGFYGLLEKETFVPNPDYYSALLWHRLMGKGVLGVKTNASEYLRTYVHCSKGRAGITILLINLSKQTTFTVRVSNGVEVVLQGEPTKKRSFLETIKIKVSWVGKKASDGYLNREEYHLSPKDNCRR